MKKNQLSANPV